MSVESLGNPIAWGRTAEVYAWKEGYVLKLFHEWFPSGAVEHEARIADVIHEAGLPAPAAGKIIEMDGRVGLVYERVTGTSMMEAMVAKPWTILQSARILAELQVGMHRVEGVPDLPSQHEWLREKIQAAEKLSPDLRQAALRVLEKLPEGNHLCHGDFHPGNVLMTGGIVVVIDWIDATRGNPFSDVARSSLLLDKSPLPEGTPVRRILALMRGWFHRAYLRHYFRLQPGDWEDLAAWRMVNAAARLSEEVPEDRELLTIVQQGLSK